MKKQAAVFSVFLLLVGAFSGQLFAQSGTGTILGTVSDPTDAVILGATVTITNQGTNIAREVTTDSSGRYVVPLLPVGRYTIRVSSPGFAQGEVTDLVLEVQDNRTVDFTLSVAAAGQVVEVTKAYQRADFVEAGS